MPEHLTRMPAPPPPVTLMPRGPRAPVRVLALQRHTSQRAPSKAPCPCCSHRVGPRSTLPGGLLGLLHGGICFCGRNLCRKPSAHATTARCESEQQQHQEEAHKPPPRSTRETCRLRTKAAGICHHIPAGEQRHWAVRASTVLRPIATQRLVRPKSRAPGARMRAPGP